LRLERRVVGDMTTDIVRGMILVGFVIGVAVAGLVAYSQTLAQLRDYGILRALGLSARRALTLGVVQVAALVAGFLSPLLSAPLAVAYPLSPTLVLSIRARRRAGGARRWRCSRGSAVPVIRVVRVEPASVFRRTS
jgi:putative ABC transport system permease protein